ncbi:MAG TPA: FHA domain-containing protein, partial [Frankiaceae bacterium]|nr:FHA domain-containing protein [Frankiaceae bacterium]
MAQTASADLDCFRLAVTPGGGVVARFPGVVLVVPAAPDAQRPVTATLLDLCEEAAGDGAAPGRRLLRRLAGLLAEADPDEVPGFCVLGAASGRVAALVHGDVDLVAAGGRWQ